MEQLNIAAKPRERKNKGENGRLRRAGQIPSVVYGGQAEPVMVAVGEHEIEMILRGASRSSAVFRLEFDGGKSEQTMLRDIVRHPVTSRVQHIDFQRIDLESEVEIEVPIHVVGHDPAGVRNGGILEHVHRAVYVRCRPLEMPQHLDADLSDLDMHQTFHVSDLKLPAGVAVVDAPETALFSIVAPAVEAAPAEGEGEAAAPELAGKKKEGE